VIAALRHRCGLVRRHSGRRQGGVPGRDAHRTQRRSGPKPVGLGHRSDSEDIARHLGVSRAPLYRYLALPVWPSAFIRLAVAMCLAPWTLRGRPNWVPLAREAARASLSARQTHRRAPARRWGIQAIRNRPKVPFVCALIRAASKRDGPIVICTRRRIVNIFCGSRVTPQRQPGAAAPGTTR
jgi:hypothetical protein